MAIRSVATTDTLGTFRTTFNSLGTDMGDLTSLNTSHKSTIVGAINEAITLSSSFILRDSTSSIQEIASGDTLNVIGTSNEVEVAVSATDTLTIGLPAAVSITTSVSAPTVTDGTASINSGAITGVTNITASGQITGITNVTGSGTANFTADVQVNSVSVATKPFAIAQAIALG